MDSSVLQQIFKPRNRHISLSDSKGIVNIPRGYCQRLKRLLIVGEKRAQGDPGQVSNSAKRKQKCSSKLLLCKIQIQWPTIVAQIQEMAPWSWTPTCMYKADDESKLTLSRVSQFDDITWAHQEQVFEATACSALCYLVNYHTSLIYQHKYYLKVQNQLHFLDICTLLPTSHLLHFRVSAQSYWPW